MAQNTNGQLPELSQGCAITPKDLDILIQAGDRPRPVPSCGASRHA
jgi:hypothetical protein